MSSGAGVWTGAGGGIPPVFAAKLRQPDPGLCLRRDRLFQRLDAAAATPLVVVHAGAGYGKTTLVASYLRERGRPAVWYHIGTTDRLPGTMVAHLCHAVAQACPGALSAGPDPLEALEDPELAGAALAALLGRPGGPLTLVLEEYNRAREDSEIHRVVLALVEHLPPHVQVLLLSRSRPPLPLARLTMSGRVAELTKADLAFTLEETAALFARTYGCYLSAKEFALVAQRLEGWAVGLQLTHAALKVTTEPERDRFWARFAESPALFDYLAEEVLAALPEATLHFLHQTAIFSVLQPELIDEFLPGCGAAATLARLARENLFTIPLGAAGTDYRYHNLFRRYLHRRLRETVGEDGVRRLHGRAAELYARRDELDYAIGHSLAAGDYPRVARLLGRLADRHRADVLLRLMEGWLERAFPDMEHVPGVILRRLLPMSLYELVLPGLQQVAGAGDVDPVTRAHAQQRLGTYYYYRGRLDECLVWLERSRDAFRAAGHLVPACISSTLIGLAHLFKGMPELAEGAVADALAWAGDEHACVRVNALWAKAELALALGRYQEAEEAARSGLEHDTPYQIGVAFAYGTLAAALLRQGRPADALAAGIAGLGHALAPTDRGFAHHRLALVLRAMGNHKGARAAAEKAVRHLDGFDFMLARALLCRADLAAAAGDPAAPRLWAEARSFWDQRGYRMHPGYDSLAAPLLLGGGQQPRPAGAAAATAGGPSPVAPAPGGAPAGTAPAGTAPAGAPLIICTLGTFRLQILGRDSHPSRWGRAPSRRLFFYLLLHRGRRVHRDEILEALWPGDDDLAACSARLASAVSVLRRELAPLSQLVERRGQVYSLQLPPGTDLDLDRYGALAAKGLARADQAALREAAALYRGDFLAEYPYDEFLDVERTRLRELHRRLVLALAGMAWQREDLDGALTWYREAQRLEPLLEEPVRRIMEIFLARGEPAAAADAYRRLRSALRAELGLDPTAELHRLYDRAVTQTRHRPA